MAASAVRTVRRIFTTLCIATWAAFTLLLATVALAGPSQVPPPVVRSLTPATPYELGVVRGTRIVAQSLAQVADVSRWGMPVPLSTRLDESFRRRSSVSQLSYSHWGYISAVKAFVDSLSTHTLILNKGFANAQPVSINNTQVTSYWTVSSDAQQMLAHFAGELRILGDLRRYVASSFQDDTYMLGNEAYAAMLIKRGKFWAARLAVEETAPAPVGVLGHFNRMFIRSAPGAGTDHALERLRSGFGFRTNGDYEVGLLHGSRALIMAASVVSTDKAKRAAFVAYHRLRKGEGGGAAVGLLSSDDEVVFFDEDYQEESWVGSRPYVEFQLGYAQALLEINNTLDQLLSDKVIAQLNLKDKKERIRFLQEWALASSALKGTAGCAQLLEPEL